MKTVVFLLVVCLGLTGFQGPPKKAPVVGTWKVVDFKADLPDLSAQIIADGRAEALSSEFVFRKNGNSRLTSLAFNRGQDGTWVYDEETKRLDIMHDINPEMGPESYIVQSVERKKMVWLQELSGLGTLTMTLEKQ